MMWLGTHEKMSRKQRGLAIARSAICGAFRSLILFFFHKSPQLLFP
jgi:hypothetical protein